MGYHDSNRELINAVRNGFVSIKVVGDALEFSGDTYTHKDFIKRELRGTDLHFDSATKTWRVHLDTLYSTDKAHVYEWTRGELDIDALQKAE